MEKNLKKEVYKMFIGVFSLAIVMVAVFAISGFFDMGVVWGAIIGSAGCTLNYLFLAYSINNVVKKDPEMIKGYMAMSYTFRMFFIAAVIILAIKLPGVNYIAAVVPFLFPRIVLMIMNIKMGRNRGTVKKEGE